MSSVINKPLNQSFLGSVYSAYLLLDNWMAMPSNSLTTKCLLMGASIFSSILANLLFRMPLFTCQDSCALQHFRCIVSTRNFFSTGSLPSRGHQIHLSRSNLRLCGGLISPSHNPKYRNRSHFFAAATL